MLAPRTTRDGNKNYNGSMFWNELMYKAVEKLKWQPVWNDFNGKYNVNWQFMLNYHEGKEKLITWIERQQW